MDKYKVLLKAVYNLLKKQEHTYATLDLLYEEVKYNGVTKLGLNLMNHIGEYLDEGDMEFRKRGMWTRYKVDDMNTMPPANVPLFVAFNQGKDKYIKLGILCLQEDDSYVWRVDGRKNFEDACESSMFSLTIDDKDVVAWVVMPRHFPGEVG